MPDAPRRGAIRSRRPIRWAPVCTSFVIGSPASGLVYGRTTEFHLPLHSAVVVAPAGASFTGTDNRGRLGAGGLTWTATRGAVWQNTLGIEGAAIDGMNDAGLVVGTLNFALSADYQTVAEADQSKSVASLEVAHYLLTTCATVAEVRAALGGLLVQNVAAAAYGGQVPRVHWTVHDTAGNHVVVEYVGGECNVYDNPTTVMTNEPPFPMQLAHLAEYSFLTADPPAPIEVGGLTLAAPGPGGGMAALPGGFLSSSRFVRAFFASRCAPGFATAAEGVEVARHIVNGFDIPPGSVVAAAEAASSGGAGAAQLTEWSVIHDMANRVSHLNSHRGPDWTRVDVRALCQGATGVTSIPFPEPAPPRELSLPSPDAAA